MKKVVRVIGSLVVLGLLTGMMASELNNHYETTFVSGCAKDAGKRISVVDTVKICLCTWQAIDDKYTTEELEFIDRKASENSRELIEFMKFTDSRTIMCVQKYSQR